MSIRPVLSEFVSVFDFADRNSVLKFASAYHEIDSNAIKMTYVVAAFVLQKAFSVLEQIKASDPAVKELIEQSDEDVLVLEIACYLTSRALDMLVAPEKAYDELVKVKETYSGFTAAIVDLRDCDEEDIRIKFDFLYDVKEALETIFSREAGYDRLIVKSVISVMYDLYQSKEGYNARETLFTALYVSINRRVFDEATAEHIQKTVIKRYKFLADQLDDPVLNEPAYKVMDATLKILDTNFIPSVCNQCWNFLQTAMAS